ncbi:MAG: SDR family NAD(P)-dependent oxidoreductase, partial [Chitinophagales bacterium]
MKAKEFGKEGWTPERIGDLSGKTYVITGTTSGTGFEAARILLSKGAKVVMLNRNPKKSEVTIHTLKQELGNDINVLNIRMDLAEQASVRKAAMEVLEKMSRIDALICNAAIAQVPKKKLTVDDFESQLGVNHYGHFTLQGMLFPMIEKSKGRIVTVGSMGYDMGLKTIKFDDMNWDKDYTANDAYSQSKLAQIMSIYELQDRLKEAGKTDVKAYACHPGSSRTSLIATSGSLMMRIIFGLMKLSPLTQAAEKGAYPQLMCATEKDL